MPNKIFTKAQLKPLMAVKTRNENKFFCVQTENNEIFLVDKTDKRLSIDKYNNTLDHIEDKDLDIMKVYNPSAATLCLGIEAACDGKNLIFEKSEIDWSKVPVDAKVFVCTSETECVKRHFAKYENNLVYIYKAGATSWSRPDAIYSAEKSMVRLAEPQEKRQPEEIFRVLEEFPKYRISNKGRLFSENGEINTKTDNFGTKYVNIYTKDGSRKTKSLNALVATAFIPNPDNKKYAVIIDRTKPFSVENIAWANNPREFVNGI